MLSKFNWMLSKNQSQAPLQQSKFDLKDVNFSFGLALVHREKKLYAYTMGIILDFFSYENLLLVWWIPHSACWDQSDCQMKIKYNSRSQSDNRKSCYKKKEIVTSEDPSKSWIFESGWGTLYPTYRGSSNVVSCK